MGMNGPPPKLRPIEQRPLSPPPPKFRGERKNTEIKEVEKSPDLIGWLIVLKIFGF